ncbi:MAG: hypothetical protein ACKOC5_10770 [Chloroflexota bacterium]
MSSNRSKSSLLVIMFLAGVGLLAVCCIAGFLIFWPASEDSQVADEPPAVEMATQAAQDQPEEPAEPVDAPTQAPAGPQDAPAEPGQFTLGAQYTHPTEGFQVAAYGDRYDEGENYVTFYDDTNVVDVTIFDLQGSLNQNSLAGLANEVLKAVLIDTDWAQEYTLTEDAPVEINAGYLVYFNYTDSTGTPAEGALFLRQADRKLAALTLLAPDADPVLETFGQMVESYLPSGAELAEQPAETQPAQPDGPLTSGLQVDVDGFSFENYGKGRGILHLTPVEMRRMFGDKVCASFEDNQCVLKPAAKSWMREANDAMSGGHCEGMAVLSQLFYYGAEKPNDFGAGTTYSLEFGNQELQREIAYWWVTQSTNPGGTIKVNESPKAVVEALIENFQQGREAREWWVVGIYQRDGSGGHAITPIGVEQTGDDQYDILVYDNNWPGEVRRINVDMRQNTWYYLAATNPNEAEAVYEGDQDTQTLEIVAISPRIGQQACTFCSGRGQVADASGPRSLARGEYYEIYLDGNTDLLITDDQDRSVGYIDGKLINEIPDAQMDTFRFGMDVWAEDYEPIYKIPVGTTFGIAVQGANITEPSTATVTIIGPGFYMEISDILLDPGDVEALGVSNDGKFFGLAYLSDYTETPVVSMGIEGEEVSYAFIAQATELTGAEDTLNVGIDLETGEFVLNSQDNVDPGTYDIYILRLDQDGLAAFGTSGLILEPGETVYLQYLNWTTNGQVLTAEVDLDGDGVIDQVLELPDTSDEFTWE